jgi:hypothetical protein
LNILIRNISKNIKPDGYEELFVNPVYAAPIEHECSV